MAESSEIGKRMKHYEKLANFRLLNQIPVIARLDGKCFHKFCKNLDRPFDLRLSSTMIKLAKFLVDETNARCAYTQSDEISMIWLAKSYKSSVFFDYKLQKMNSVLASMCSVYFNKLIKEAIPDKINTFPLFDCRVWNVPNETEAVNYLVWRELDATKNSVGMAASCYYSASELDGKKNAER